MSQLAFQRNYVPMLLQKRVDCRGLDCPLSLLAARMSFVSTIHVFVFRAVDRSYF